VPVAKAIQAFRLEQPMNEIPIILVLPAVGTRGQRIERRKPEPAARLGMLVKDIRNDIGCSSVLPNALIATELQGVHPGRETKLVSRQGAVRSQPSRRVHITVMGLVRLVGLLNPQCYRLRDECLEFDIVRGRDHIDSEFKVPPETRTAYYPLWNQTIWTQAGIKFDQSVILQQTVPDCAS
jgi:hypothetical protein